MMGVASPVGSFKSIKEFLTHGLPDFCWQTSYEVLTFVEQLYEDVDEDVLKSTLSKLAASGKVERKNFIRTWYGQGTTRMCAYKRKESVC